MSTLKFMYEQFHAGDAGKMMDDTHKDVLLHPIQAISNLANRVTDELSCEDELMHLFSPDPDAVSTGGIYTTALDDPATFVQKMKDSDSIMSTLDKESGVRSWVTLAFMLECRKDIHAYGGKSKQFYKAWLLSELLHLEDAEGAAKAAAAPAAPAEAAPTQ